MNEKSEYSEAGGDLLTTDTPRIVALLASMERTLEKLERTMKNCKPLLRGEYYLTDREASERLRVTRQTLQEYRNQGKIPYCQLGGKILYRAGDIEKMLEDNYREAYR